MISSFINKHQLKAVLGPTNTGKTHYAMERMLAHKSGMIGFPLRLLARENYEKAVKIVGKSKVALITGEEKIIPENAKFFCCTVESMPINKNVAFLSVDEIQLAGDQERGYIFTDRLLNARGIEETIFLGSNTIENLIKFLLPKCKIETRPRLSSLTYAGVKKITRLKPRSAIVTFSIQEIYKIAELIRSYKGGAAVVMGALSPRTRNSQVDLYQTGQVDYLIATDAIGMGLNLDIDHVAFASNSKFDGNTSRYLYPNEIAQIAGRAGRFSKNGTFGVISEDLVFEKSEIQMVESHDFPSLQKIWWRNPNLDMNSVKALINSLDAPSPSKFLRKKSNAIDLISLNKMLDLDVIKKNQTNKEIVSLLWEICKVPDFGNIFSDRHIQLLYKLFEFLLRGKIDNNWIKLQIDNLNRIDGDIDTLLNRISNIRTWTYITNKNKWVKEPDFWQNKTKLIEDKLSDELHERLTKRFVDKKIVILTKKISENSSLEATVKFDGKVIVEGQEVGVLKSFDFKPDVENADHYSRILKAARKGLQKQLEIRVKEFINSSENALKLDNLGNILWMENSIAKLAKGIDIYNPKILMNDLDMLSLDQKRKVEEKCNNSIKKLISLVLNECIRFKELNLVNQFLVERMYEEKEKIKSIITSKIKVIIFNVYEGLGCAETKKIPFSLKQLNDSERKILAKLGLRIGTEMIYLPNLLKPKAISLRSILWSVYNNNFPEEGPPKPGRVICNLCQSVPNDYFKLIGYMPFKSIALRVDILERLSAIIRNEAKKVRFKINEDMLSIAGATKDQVKEILFTLGYKIIEEVKSNKLEILIPIFIKKKVIKNMKGINKNKFKKNKHFKKSENLDSPFQILKKLKI